MTQKKLQCIIKGNGHYKSYQSNYLYKDERDNVLEYITNNDYDKEYSELLKFEQEKRELEYQLSEEIEKKEELVEKRTTTCTDLEQFESTLNEVTVQEAELTKQPDEFNKKFEDVMSLIRVKTAELNSEKK